jgi:cell division protein FtsL
MSTGTIPQQVDLGEVQLVELGGIVKSLQLAIALYGQHQLVPVYERLIDKMDALNKEFGFEAMKEAAVAQHDALAEAGAVRLAEIRGDSSEDHAAEFGI